MKISNGGVKNLVLIILWVFILMGGFFLPPAGAVQLERDSRGRYLPTAETIDYDTAARIAIQQSPYLTKSDLEIQIRRLDEKDSKSDYFPSLNFRTRYYVNNVSVSGNSLSPGTRWNSPPAPIAPGKPISLYRSAQ